eukprot:scaffold34652_cov211-Amphora_coffeaeformis.AAC.7
MFELKLEKDTLVSSTTPVHHRILRRGTLHRRGKSIDVGCVFQSRTTRRTSWRGARDSACHGLFSLGTCDPMTLATMMRLKDDATTEYVRRPTV